MDHTPFVALGLDRIVVVVAAAVERHWIRTDVLGEMNRTDVVVVVVHQRAYLDQGADSIVVAGKAVIDRMDQSPVVASLDVEA